MDRKKQAVDVEDGLSSVKIGIYTLIRLGLPLEDIVEKINGVIKEVVQSEDITLLSEDVSGLVSDRHITVLLQTEMEKWPPRVSIQKRRPRP